ncbi:hypothetical protein MRB53_041530 [Persea americana]|nr:hypothetical protein MRB53_041530 [Persea americana]
MVGRTRRVRLIVAAGAVFLVYFLFKSTLSARINSAYNYYKQSAIQASIDAKTWEPVPDDPERVLVEWAWEPRAFQPATHILGPAPFAMDQNEPQEAEATASSTAVVAGDPWAPARAATTTANHEHAKAAETSEALLPRITKVLGFEQDPMLEYEVDESRHPPEQGPLATATARPTSVRWIKHSEKYPVSTTISLPTGSPSPIPLIQHSKRATAATERLTAIKEAAKHAWKGFRERGWGHDEVKPVEGAPRDSFNGWGATLIDSLDTLWIMGMREEFDEAVAKVDEIDFSTSTRDDIPVFEVTIRYMGGLLAAYDVSGGKYQSLLDKAVELADHLFAVFDTPNRMPITYYRWKQDPDSEHEQNHRASTNIILAELGSLSMEFTRLAQLTGNSKYYDAIARVTDAFEAWQNNTRLPGMWPVRFDASGCMKPAAIAANLTHKASLVEMEDMVANRQPGIGKIEAFGNPILEGSLDDPRAKDRLLSSETKGSHPKRAVDAADTNVCTPQGLASTSQHSPETFTLGGASDSTYEYLPKEYLLLGGRVEQYKTMYLASMQTVIDNILYRPMIPDNHDILISGDVVMHYDQLNGPALPRPVYRAEHLTCFAGGMFAMGGKIFNVPAHVEIGRKLTDGCIWSYNSTVSKIMPEIFYLTPCADPTSCAWNETRWHDALDPFKAIRSVNQDDNNSTTSAINDPTLSPRDAASALLDLNAPVSPADLALLQSHDPSSLATSHSLSTSPGRAALIPHAEFVAQKIKTERLSPSFTRIDGRKYQLRPEAIESVFYMYRITGEPYWREQGWHMFNAIEKLTRAPFGHSALEDVTVDEPLQNNLMESFWTAETLKYFYLLFDDSQTWSLDDWVLNTEAHFFRRPANPAADAGKSAVPADGKTPKKGAS